MGSRRVSVRHLVDVQIFSTGNWDRAIKKTPALGRGLGISGAGSRAGLQSLDDLLLLLELGQLQLIVGQLLALLGQDRFRRLGDKALVA